MIARKMFSLIGKIRSYLSSASESVEPVCESQNVLNTGKQPDEKLSSLMLKIETFNFMDNEVMRNPYPYYEVLRERGAIHFLPFNKMWLFLNHQDIAAALKQPHIFSSAPMGVYEKVMLGADLAAHKSVRSLLAPYFSLQSVAKQAENIKKDTLDLLGKLLQKPHFDAVGEFINPLVEKNLARFLTLPPEKHQELNNCLDSIDENIQNRYLEEFSVLRHFFGQYISSISTNLDEHFCFRLINGKDDEKLSPEETASLMTLLWIAGTKTTEESLGKAILKLLSDQEIRTALEKDSTLIPQYFEEVLRFAPPVRAVYRQTVSEVEISGVKIPSGASVCLCFEAANRDAKVFLDPNRFDLKRNSKEHLSFSFGAHYCLGVHLGRLYAQIILETLVKNCPALCLDAKEKINIDNSPDFRPLKKLIVTARNNN